MLVLVLIVLFATKLFPVTLFHLEPDGLELNVPAQPLSGCVTLDKPQNCTELQLPLL